MTEDWTTQFEGLRDLPADEQALLRRSAHPMHLPAGRTVFAPGQEAQTFFLLRTGTVRVQQQTETGREVFLYRVHAGESCILTTACLLSSEAYTAEAITETEVTAVAIPRAGFEAIIAGSAAFRRLVFHAYARRIADLFALIDDILSQRMDVRLAARLLALADDSGQVQATHQVLAHELGTAREVITRTLAEFHRRGWIAQARGAVRLADPEALRQLARGGTR